MKSQKIGLLGHFGNMNMGDDAILQAIVENIRRYCPEAAIYGFSSVPVDTQKRHDILVLPLHRTSTRRATRKSSEARESSGKGPFKVAVSGVKSLLRKNPITNFVIRALSKSNIALNSLAEESKFIFDCYKACKTLDVLMISGGGQLDDSWGGPWDTPYTLFKYAVLAKIAKTRLFFISQGAGPINLRLSKFFIKWALTLADFRSYRDRDSKNLIESIGVKKESHVFPDLAFSLNLKKNHSREHSSPIVGISPMVYCDPRFWPEKNQVVNSAYKQKVSELVLWFLKNGYTVSLFASQLKMDPVGIDDVKKELKKDEWYYKFCDQIIEPEVQTVSDLIAAISQTQFIITSRLHGAILAYLSNKPVLALSYHEKIEAMMSEMGQSDLCFNIEDFKVEEVKAKISWLESNSMAVQDQIRKQVVAHQIALQAQYRLILTGS